MISFVTWKWTVPGMPRQFDSSHVNVLRAMVARHYAEPHRFICVTDEPRGLDDRIEVVPMPVTFDHIGSPHGKRFPSCYRRLWNFSSEARSMLGDRIFQIDIDVVITGDLTKLVNSNAHANFVGWCDPLFQWNKIAGGAYMLTTGSMPHIWDDFDPDTSPQKAHRAGCSGSDQGWMSHKLYPPPASWSKEDGIVKMRWLNVGDADPPKWLRMAFTSGVTPPWSPVVQKQFPWIKKHWTL